MLLWPTPKHCSNEATLLLQHAHRARAYFLAVASIEEVGKAVQAFDGMGRNLKDDAVSTQLKKQFDDHQQKISSAFYSMVRGASKDFIKSL